MLNLNAQLQQLKSSTVELEKTISAQGDRLATLNQQIQRLQEQQQQPILVTTGNAVSSGIGAIER
jgi:CII-binding regulator of phage lambda lysogenization HflD